MLLEVYEQAPGDELDYYLDWNAWLAGDTIVTSTWVATGVATMYNFAVFGGVTCVWVKELTLDTLVDLTNQIFTTEGRKVQGTVRIKVRN